MSIIMSFVFVRVTVDLQDHLDFLDPEVHQDSLEQEVHLDSKVTK